MALLRLHSHISLGSGGGGLKTPPYDFDILPLYIRFWSFVQGSDLTVK